MRLSDICKQRVEVKVPINGEELVVGYNPAAYTPNKAAELDDAEGDDARSVAKLLSEVITDWDLIGDDGEPYPTTLEALCDVPNLLLGKVLTAIVADIRPDPTPGSSSASGS